MVVNKPTIIIYTQEADSDLLHEVCSGIEEEGLLFEVHEKSGELDELAHAAAEDSMLGSGDRNEWSEDCHADETASKRT